MGKWKSDKLSNIAEINTRSIGKDYPYTEIEYIDISSVGSGILFGTNKYNLSDAPGRAKRLVNHGDTILSTVRPNRRSFLYIKNPNDNVVVSTGFAVLTPKQDIDSRFLYFVVTSQSFTDYLTANAKGSAYPAVDTEIIGKASLSIPSLLEQRKIAAILSAYDDLIENNTRRIKILEEMAQRLYQEWFVKFRFPGHEKVKFMNSEFGKIPEGWRITSLCDICNIEKNKYKESEHSTLPLLDLARIPRKSLAINSLGLSSELKTSRIIFRKNSILFGSIRPYFHKIFYTFCDGITNTSVFVIKPVESIPVSFLFSLLFSEDSVNWANQNSGGTKMPVISWNIFKTMKVVLPCKDLLNKYDSIANSFLDTICILNLMNLKLKQTRDLLLPKLISGELDVSDLDIKIKDKDV